MKKKLGVLAVLLLVGILLFNTDTARAVTGIVQMVTGRAAAYTVAFPDSSAYFREQADYMGNGVDDALAINEAIASAHSWRGGKVVMADGVAHIKSPIRIFGGITLEGQGMGIEDEVSGAATRLSLEADSTVILVDSPYYEYWPNLSRFTINANYQSLQPAVYYKNGGSDSMIDNIFIRQTRGDGIYYETGWYHRLDNVWVEGIGQSNATAAGIKTKANLIMSNVNFNGANAIDIEAPVIIQASNLAGDVGNSFFRFNMFAGAGGARVQITNSRLSSSGVSFMAYGGAGGYAQIDNTYILTRSGSISDGVRLQMTNSNYSSVAGNPNFGLYSDLSPGRSDVFYDLVSANTTYIASAQPFNSSISYGQPDKARNVTVTINDPDSSITSYSIRVIGYDALGEQRTETFTETSGLVGSTAFVRITSVTASASGSNGDSFDLGIGTKLGLSNNIFVNASVFAVKKNNADYPSYTASGGYNTVDVGSISDGDTFTVYYKGNDNIPRYGN